MYFHIEHQSSVDSMMPYRILMYEREIVANALLNRKRGERIVIPLIISMVIYSGEARWNVPLNLREMQEKWGEYEEGIELSEYNLLDINKIDNEELLEEKDSISKLMILEKTRTEEDMEKNLLEISKHINLDKECYTKEEIDLIQSEIEAGLENKFGKEIASILLKKLDIREVKKMSTLAERLELDRERKIRKAKKDGKMEIIKNMLREKFSIDAISRVSGFKISEIKKIAKTI